MMISLCIYTCISNSHYKCYCIELAEPLLKKIQKSKTPPRPPRESIVKSGSHAVDKQNTSDGTVIEDEETDVLYTSGEPPEENDEVQKEGIANENDNTSEKKQKKLLKIKKKQEIKKKKDIKAKIKVA